MAVPPPTVKLCNFLITADAQTGLRLCCSQTEDSFSHVVAHFISFMQYSSAHVLFLDSIQNTRIVDKHELHFQSDACILQFETNFKSTFYVTLMKILSNNSGKALRWYNWVPFVRQIPSIPGLRYNRFRDIVAAV